MARRTAEDLLEQERHINNFLERCGSEERVVIQWAYGNPRLHIGPKDNPNNDLSPRLPVDELSRWIDAFIEGLDTGAKLRQADSDAFEAIKEIIGDIGYDLDLHTEGWRARQKSYVRLFFDGGVVAEESGYSLAAVLNKILITAKQLSRRGC